MKSTKEWISISDMMTGLMMVFLFISILYMSQVEKQSKEIKEINIEIQEIATGYKDYKSVIYKELNKEFQVDLKRWNAKILEDSLVIRFLSFNIMFKAGSSIVEPAFQKILEDFCPRYFKLLYSLKQNIEEIRIEGHTSSEWGKLPPKSAYFKNMKLSQNRTRSVLQYCVTLKNVEKEINEWARKKLTANGLSSSRPLKKCKQDTIRHRSCNRRVEFRIQIDESSILRKIIQIFKKVSL